ncbi:hypothetical protein Metfor_2490 [Methanoregula formicica SMSP]|uniref:Uncharacterized protein n=1 Tax=Methanoregula formicica (strain DSM 22288 / NBRC 105244 / SMSP) TaxID=593750 RepID=L0HK85_METFS|nr:hypothetical protein Metfor_2490 [Methanoregula formicica SMSP]
MELYYSPFASFPIGKLTNESHQRQPAIAFMPPDIPHRVIFARRMENSKTHFMYSNIWFIRRMKSKKEPESGLFVRPGEREVLLIDLPAFFDIGVQVDLRCLDGRMAEVLLDHPEVL